MLRKRYSVKQIIAILEQAELGVPVGDIVRKVGISEQTFYRWKKRYGGPVSGASMNPARSLGPALISGEFGSLWIYLVGPVSGALLACPTCRWIRGNDCRTPEKTESA